MTLAMKFSPGSQSNIINIMSKGALLLTFYFLLLRCTNTKSLRRLPVSRGKMVEEVQEIDDVLSEMVLEVGVIR